MNSIIEHVGELMLEPYKQEYLNDKKFDRVTQQFIDSITHSNDRIDPEDKTSELKKHWQEFNTNKNPDSFESNVLSVFKSCFDDELEAKHYSDQYIKQLVHNGVDVYNNLRDSLNTKNIAREINNNQNRNQTPVIVPIPVQKEKIGKSLIEVENELKERTGNKISLEFFFNYGVKLELNFEKAIRTSNVIEVFGDCQDESLYCVLALIRKLELDNSVTIVSKSDNYKSFKPESSNDILIIVVDENMFDQKPIPNCINIRIYNRNETSDSNEINRIAIRGRSKTATIEALAKIFNHNYQKARSIFYSTSGNYDEIETEIANYKAKYTWSKITTILNPNEFKCLESLLFLNSFYDLQRETLAKLGLNIDSLLQTAAKIDIADESAVPLLRSENGILKYKPTKKYYVVTPKKLWFYCNKQDSALPSKFFVYIKALITTIKDEDDYNLIENALYHLLKENYTTRQRIEIASIVKEFLSNLDSLPNKNQLLSVLTEIEPYEVLNWMKNDEGRFNEETLFKLLSIKRTSKGCAKFILNTYQTNPELKSCVIHILNPYYKTTMLSESELLEILNTYGTTKNYISVINTLVLLDEHLLYNAYFKCNNKSDLVPCKKRELETIKTLSNRIIAIYIKNLDYNQILEFVKFKYFFFITIEYHTMVFDAILKIKESLDEAQQIQIYIKFYKRIASAKINKTLFENQIPIFDSLLSLIEPIEKKYLLIPYFLDEYEDFDSEEHKSLKREKLTTLIQTYNLTSSDLLDCSKYFPEGTTLNLFLDVYNECFDITKLNETQLSNCSAQIATYLIKEYRKATDKESFREQFLSLPQSNQDQILQFLPSVCIYELKDNLTKNQLSCFWKNLYFLQILDKDMSILFWALKCLEENQNYNTLLRALYTYDEFIEQDKIIYDYIVSVPNDFQINPALDHYLDLITFSRLRAAISPNTFSLEQITELEIRFLSPEYICKGGSAFSRLIQETPKTYARLFSIAYKNDDGLFSTSSNQEFRDKASEIINKFKFSKALSDDYIHQWFLSLIQQLENQNQTKITHLAISYAITSMIPDIEKDIPKQVCLELRSMCDDFPNLIGCITSNLFDGLFNEAFYWDEQIKLSFNRMELFSKLAQKKEDEGFYEASCLYQNLSEYFKSFYNIETEYEI